MRTPTEHVAKDGKRTWKIRFREAGQNTSETFHRRQDAVSFAVALDTGGVLAAREWLVAREKYADVVTFGEWFSRYVDQLTGVTDRTRADYRKMGARYFAELDSVPLPLVSRGYVTSLVNELETRGLSPKTIKNVVHTLSSCLGLAVEEGHIVRNPCRRVRLPKASLDQVQNRFLEPGEFRQLYDATPPEYRPLVTFLVGTGLRWSEATALARHHVSLERGTVRVERAWKWQGAGKGWVISTPKSTKSRRTVNAAVIALKAVAPLLEGDPAGLVFTTPSGRPVRHNNFYNRIWVPATERAGLVGLRIHDLRHTHASWLLSDGQMLEAVQDQLGHESILTTRKVYAGLLPALGAAVGRSASQTLAQALAQGPEPAVQLGPGSGREGAVQSMDQPDDALHVGADGRRRGGREE